MFNIGAGELLLILLVAFFVVGPEDLPKVARGIKKFLKSAKSFISQAKEESGWNDIVKEVNKTGEDIKKEIDKTGIKQEIDSIKKDLDDSKKQLEELEHPVKSAMEKIDKAPEELKKQTEEALKDKADN